LVDNNCHIWDGDAYKRYLNTYKGNFELDKEEFINAIKTSPDFAKQWGELGPIYGKQWRSWPTYSVGETTFKTGIYTAWRNEADQIANLINDLKTNPDSRRLMVNAWNVGELDSMTLPPCHYGFQVYTRELSARERTALKSNGSTRLYDSIKEENYQTVDADDVMHTVCDEYNVPKRAISLMWNQRSVDTFLGLPFNIASYGLLLEIIAKEVNMVPDELIGNLGDTHLYLNHIEQAKEQIGRDLTEDERYELVTQQMSKLRAITDEDYIKYNIPTRTKEPYLLPTLNIKLHFKNEPSFTPEYWLTDDFELLNYQSHPTIKAPLSN
jgi:thymidylate synthase